jgi:hypothetical protein
MLRNLIRVSTLVIAVIGATERFGTTEANAAVSGQGCGSFQIDKSQAFDDTLFYLSKNKWLRSSRSDSFPKGEAIFFAYVANDARDLDGGMVLVKIVDFYQGQKVRDSAVKLHRDAYKKIKGEMARHFDGTEDIVKYQKMHAGDRGADFSQTVRNFHAKDYVVKGNETRSTRSKDKKSNFLFEEYELTPSDSLIAYLIGKAIAGTTKDPSVEDKVDPNKISVDQFSARLKYYTHDKSKSFDMVCFSIKARDEALKTKITIRDFEYDGQLRDADPVGRSTKWTINWK